MAYTDKDAIYEIAEKLGYTGDEGLTTTEAVYAVAAALGYTGEHDKSVALALSDLKTVVGGGGGGDLGALTNISILDAEPVVDSALSEADASFTYVMLGDAVVASASSGFGEIACGSKAYAWLYEEDKSASITVTAWKVTYEDDGHDFVCKSATALSGATCGVTYGDPLSLDESATWAYLVIPDPSTLVDGEVFAFSIVNSNN